MALRGRYPGSRLVLDRSWCEDTDKSLNSTWDDSAQAKPTITEKSVPLYDSLGRQRGQGNPLRVGRLTDHIEKPSP